jgi:hypothetical protein
MLFKESLVIDASSRRVWEYLGTPDCWYLFDDKVIECMLTSSQGGCLGAVYKTKRRMGQRTTWTRDEIVAIQPESLIKMRSMVVEPHEAAAGAVVTYELFEHGSGTKVNATCDMDLSRLSIFIRAIVWFIARFGYHAAETPLQKLKRIVEVD